MGRDTAKRSYFISLYQQCRQRKHNNINIKNNKNINTYYYKY